MSSLVVCAYIQHVTAKTIRTYFACGLYFLNYDIVRNLLKREIHKMSGWISDPQSIFGFALQRQCLESPHCYLGHYKPVKDNYFDTGTETYSLKPHFTEHKCGKLLSLKLKPNWQFVKVHMYVTLYE